VREFVQGISRLKLVKAHTIMEPINGSGVREGAPHVPGESDLDALIDIAVQTDGQLVVEDGGVPVGVISKTVLLRGIQGGR